jgi:Protein of unknown function (DUF1588)/Protein of unknown function (DUF1592)/Protein of unknown function (DUF1595)/Protein of unknown function (DUF1585)/Protein of unknown function (DUF1587)
LFFSPKFHSPKPSARRSRRIAWRGCRLPGPNAGHVASLALVMSACSGPVPIAEEPGPEPDASTEPSTESEHSTDNTPSTSTETSDESTEPVEDVYTCGEVNAVPYEGRLLTRAQYQNTVTDLFGGYVEGQWVESFPAENEVGGFRTNAEFHRASSWLAEAHLKAAEAIGTQVKERLEHLAPCALAANLAAPSSDPSVIEAADSCARGFLSTYGFRAFRRPLSSAEEQPFLALFETGYQEAGAPYGIELMTQALLLSPQFLYRIEVPNTAAEPGADSELVDGFGLASRLSYLLWNSMPDEELLAVAQSGSLEQPEVLRAQAERLLASPKAQAAVRDFAEQWLGLGALTGAVRRIPTTDGSEDTMPDSTSTDVVSSDTTSTDGTSTDTRDGAPTSSASDLSAPATDSTVDGNTATDSSAETDSTAGLDATTDSTAETDSTEGSSNETTSTVTPAVTDNSTDSQAPRAEGPVALDATNQFSDAWSSSLVEFVTGMYANDASFADLMLSKAVYVDTALAQLYGTPLPEGASGFVAVDFPEEERAGLLTQPGLMAMLAHPDQSAPILRGVFVLDALLCQPPPPAPATVDTTPPMLDPNATTRERFAQHTTNSSCSGCHMFIDPIGLGLENYDELGRYRATENGLHVDASGELLGLRDTQANGTFAGALDLANRLATSPQARGCFVSKWYQYGTGRGEGTRDLCTINELQASFTASGGNLNNLLVEFVLSDAFRYRTVETPEGEP